MSNRQPAAAGCQPLFASVCSPEREDHEPGVDHVLRKAAVDVLSPFQASSFKAKATPERLYPS